MLTRRHVLLSGAGLALTSALPRLAMASAPTLTVASRQLEVLGKAATVYGITGPNGPGLMAKEGDRFTGTVANQTGGDLILHWHGQVLAKNSDDRTRPDGGVQPDGSVESYDFALTPGTHWMHSHQLTEQQLLAAPMITREADAGDVPEAVVMLHDFTFRSPEEILAELGSANMHAMHGKPEGGAMQGMKMDGMDMGKMNMSGHKMGMVQMDAMGMMTHANDVAYDAYLANDRTLSDPQVITVEPGPFRLRIINGGTATAFWIDPGALPAQVIAVDGSPTKPFAARLIPLGQGQRVDLLVQIPAQSGAFPILAQVESATARTGVILATKGAQIGKVADQADTVSAAMDLSLDAALTAAKPLADKPAQMLHLALGQEANYRWTINGAAHGEAPPLEVALGSRVEMMFMNPTMMMHPMHLHGHHFQVVDVGRGRFSGPMRDVVMVPPMGMVTVAVDFDKPGDWFLHCHHLYHMAAGMMTSVKVA